MADEGILQRGADAVGNRPGEVQLPDFRAGVIRHRGDLHDSFLLVRFAAAGPLSCSLDRFEGKVGTVMGRASLLSLSLGIALALPAAAQPLKTALAPEKPVPGEAPRLGAPE